VANPVALTIAGSDPSGGAGIQADLKTFHQFKVYGEAVITLITVQNTQRVDEVVFLDAGLVGRQIDVVVQDIPPKAVKTGALGTVDIIEAVASRAGTFAFQLVVDPVMISKHGASLIATEARDTLMQKLLPHAFLVTPNLHEAEALAGISVRNMEEMEDAAASIRALGCRNVLIKGGHLSGSANDVLLTEDGGVHYYPAGRIDTPHTHGTGCTYSAAITAGLAKGLTLPNAVAVAKSFISEAIRTNPGLGHGSGPVNHHAEF
jgi:hydroxymethylpyrimidine/phosphomethylpyrimidine kinase